VYNHGGEIIPETADGMHVIDYMTKDVVSVEIPSNRDDILKILKRTGISGVPVLENGKVVGVVTRKDLLRKSEETQVALLMARNPIVIKADATLANAAALMSRHNFRRLPVVDDEGKLVGLISVADLIAAVAQLRIKDEIKDHCVSTTFALWEETPLPLVGRIMEISDVEAVPIMDDKGRVAGIISERDLIRSSHIEDSVEVSDFSNGTDDDEWTWESIRDMHVISYGVSKVRLPDRPVKMAMVKNVITVPKNAAVSECALLMKRSRLDQLPVVNGDKKLIGMLFDRDLIRVLCESPGNNNL
jgi:CBS domain-containing protein